MTTAQATIIELPQINTEQIIMQIAQCKAQIDRAEWQIGRICLDVKEQLGHGNFTSFAQDVWRILNISHATLGRYMQMAENFPQPIAQDLPLSTLYTLMKKDVPREVRDFAVQERITTPEMVEYAKRAYERKDVSDTWDELRITKSIALDGESVHVSEVTRRDLKALHNERAIVHMQGTTQEYRVQCTMEGIKDKVATLLIVGGDDLSELEGKEVSLIVRVRV